MASPPPPPPDMSSPVYWESRTAALYGGTISLQILSTIVVGLRFLSRRISGTHFWWDDWLILPALLCDWGISAASWYQVQYSGFGRHTEAFGGPVTDAQIELFLKLLMALQIFYFFSSFFFKTSIILLYYRIFGVSRTFRKALTAAWIIVLFYFIANLLAAIFECKPVSFYWDKTISGGTCVDSTAFYRWNGVANLLIDFIILTLTIPMIWRLNFALKQKISVTALFLLGTFVVIASIIRVTTFNDVVAADITYTLVVSSTWSTVEQSVGIICACLPVLPPLFHRVVGATNSWRTGKSYTSSADASYRPSGSDRSRTIRTFGQGSDKPRRDPDTLDADSVDASTTAFVKLQDAGHVVTTDVTSGKPGTDGEPGEIRRDQTVEQHFDV
ncbi:MAG: hypothetical protein M1838_002736 [Thelocarpon superellum]|nr:MAG: hypothetical protein M1838_002736 [Thelocarpon superellum]